MKYILPFVTLFLLSCGNTVYIVRHAEKAPVPAGATGMMASDPPLSEAGMARALALRDRLKPEHIRYIFSTNFKRTLSTAAPLSEAMGNIPVSIYSSKPDSLDAFISKIRGIRKGNILLVGHSNTIDDLANKLSGKKAVPGDLKDSQYDNLYRLKRKGSAYTFFNDKYGAKTD